jgi:hypothetical protein
LFHIITTIVLLSGHPGPLKAQDAPEGHDIAWQSVGPGGGGWIQSIAWDPHDPSLLYAGTSGNGAFVGKDADVGRRPIKVQ